MNTSRVTRSSGRAAAPQAVHDVLPFPEGLPNSSNEEETFLHSLNEGTYAAAQLARVDDFVVRALYERKYASKAKERASESQKFSTPAPLPNSMGVAVAQSWKKVAQRPLCEWRDGAQAIWATTVAPGLASQLLLRAEDESCFVNLILRYGLVYHPDSPIRFGSTRFPGSERPDRSIVATKELIEDTYIFRITGIASNDSIPDSLAKFSVMERKKGATKYDALLAGPIRFANHRCKPNAELFPMPDLRNDSLRLGAFYTVRTLKTIKPLEEVTVEYGEGYFTKENPCACIDCVPRGPDTNVEAGTAASSSAPPTTENPPLGKPRRRKHRGKNYRGDSGVLIAS